MNFHKWTKMLERFLTWEFPEIKESAWTSWKQEKKRRRKQNLCGSMQICNIYNKISVPFQWLWKYSGTGLQLLCFIHGETEVERGKRRVWTHLMTSPTAMRGAKYFACAIHLTWILYPWMCNLKQWTLSRSAHIRSKIFFFLIKATVKAEEKY